MSTKQAPQRARLARAIVGRTMAGIMIFTAAFAVAFAAFDAIVKPGLSNFLYFEVMGGDGGASWRLYDALTTLYLPLAALLYAAGIFLFVRSGVNRALSYFDALYEAAEGILAKRAEVAPLPPELSETAAALGAIKEERERADRAAKAAEERKNELVAYLAHDIKTPLTSIIGYLALLEESPDLPASARARYTGITLEKAYRLEELLDEFFEITRYNLHAIPIERSRFDGALFCSQVIDEFFPLAEARGLRLVYEGPQELRVFADAGKVARVVDNVLKNAVAYADPGTDVVVRTSLAKGEGGYVWWEITVTDRGRELSPQHLERIFERFYRADEARGAQTGGAGLGLAIARETARAHGGDIYVASDAGATSFTIWIPQGPSVSA